MNIKSARKLASFLKNSPFHPQWPIFQLEKKSYKYISEALIISNQKVLDIGCGHRGIEKMLPRGCSYFGLDLYETATGWYASEPDIYANAENLPLKNDTFEHVLALEVFEHIGNPDKVIIEIERVLKKNGTLIMSVPFLYPLHDEPYDFRRWTRHGLKKLIENNRNLTVLEIHENGSSIASAVIIFNLALTERYLALLKISSIFWLLAPALMITLFITNILSILDKFTSSDYSIAPLGYLLVAEKT
jgi:SAM-dependent methyltransferase